MPLRFTADGYRQLDVLASNSPFSRRVDCTTLRVPSQGVFITPRELPIDTETPGNSKLTVNGKGVFLYPWETFEDWGGTCREVVVTRDDGKQHRAFFRFLQTSYQAWDDGSALRGAPISLRGGMPS